VAFLILQHIECEHAGLLGDFLKEKGIPAHTVRLHWGEAIPAPEGYEAMVVLGGPPNVYQVEEYPFLVEEERAIKRALEKDVPLLGICLGGQLLAKALGARVSRNPVKEIGFYRVDLTDEGMKDRLFSRCGASLGVFQWHGDTFDIPEGAVRLAGSPFCANQSFRYGRRAYGLQFHVEVTPDMVASWAREYRQELASLGIAAETLVRKAEMEEATLRQLACRVFDNFVSIASSQKLSI